MDVEQILAETPSVGNKPLDSPYPYKCYRVDTNNPKYNTKQDPPSGSWTPISSQCYCGVQCTDAGDLATHKSNSHPTGSAHNVTQPVRIKEQYGNILGTFTYMYLSTCTHLIIALQVSKGALMEMMSSHLCGGIWIKCTRCPPH